MGCNLIDPLVSRDSIGLLGQVADLECHLLEQQGVEVVLWQDDSLAGKGALALDIGRAEGLLIDGYSSQLVALPQYLALVDATTVERATIIKDNSLNHIK